MKRVKKAGLGLMTLLAVGFVVLIADTEAGKRADLKACKTLQPAQVADAVISNVIWPENRVFAKFNLTANDVQVDMSGIQIGPLAVLVPFHISKDPNRQYFGMPRCSVLTDVEYAND